MEGKKPNWQGIVLNRLITLRDQMQKDGHIGSSHVNETIDLVYKHLVNKEEEDIIDADE